MTQEHLSALLDMLAAKPDNEGWCSLGDGRCLTLYTAHDGASLTIAKVEALSSRGPLVKARTSRGELYILALEGLFAAAVEAAPAQARKPGFL
jgi:hypothetical protein